MPDDSQCRMLLKNGKRCRYLAKKNGLCGHYRRLVNERKLGIDFLIKAGKYATAATALVNLGKWILDAYPKVAPVVEHIMWSFWAGSGPAGPLSVFPTEDDFRNYVLAKMKVANSRAPQKH